MKTSSILSKLALLAAITLAAIGARAEDIDLYAGNTANGPNPNILIIVDNTSSNDASGGGTCPFGTLPSGNLLDMVYCSLYGALDSIKTQPSLLGKLNIGLMSGGSGSNKGGSMFYPSTSPYNLPLMDASGIAAFQSVIQAGIPKANGNAKLDGDMSEAWAFFTGNVSSRSGTSYSPHIGTLACQKTFIILIGAASKQGRPCNGSGCGSASELAAAGASTAQQSQINTSGTPNFGPNNGDDGSWIDEWARYLNQGDFNTTAGDRQNIVTYTIAAGGDAADYAQLLASTAHYGGGKPFVAADYASMSQALLSILNEVQAVNSVFASPGLPVAANAQGSYLNQIFVGMFRPDAAGAPRWYGNLKQYQFGVTNGANGPSLFLADATGTAALAAQGTGTGFLSPNATSFWSVKDTTKLPDSIGGFWVNNPQGPGNGFDVPDGQFVEKGGVGQQIRLANLTDNYASNPTGPRNVYTCIGACAAGSSLSSTPFATSNASITAAVLGTSGPAMSISSISRSSTTATVTLAAAPSPALASGQLVTIAGSQYPEFNGSFSITPVTTTTFTYTVTVDPPTPATGSYTASVPTNPKPASLTRLGTTVTATVSAHGYTTGQQVTITGATGSAYNGSFVVTNTGANTFTYTITDGPSTPDGGGTAKVGGTTLAIPSGGIVRNPSGASNTSEVTVTLAVNVPFAVNNTVTIAGAGPGGISPYNGAWVITKLGTSCAGGSKQGNNPRSFCFNMSTTPATPDAGGSIKADGGTAPFTITGLTHAASTCAANATVLATAVTSTAPTFVAGETVSVGGTPGTNEGAYVGSFVVQSVKTTAPYNFTYNIVASPGSATSCADSTSGMTAAASGVTKDTLIRWVRGEDSGDEPSPGNGITTRGSVHGDVLHSTPLAVNYGGSTGVVVFYGANDGVFRAINANQPPAANTSPLPLGSCALPGNSTCTIGSTPPGGELWGFIPTEFYPKLQRLYANSPEIKLATTPTGITPTPAPKDYFFDGPIGLYQDIANNKTYIYLSARRGGRVIYALDVSDPTAPKFLWKRTNADTGFSELGQTWSQPKVALVHGNANPVLIFGAGYDPNEDNEPPSADGMGRGIFIVDAITGNLLWRAGPGGGSNTCTGTPCTLQDMTYAVPADITLVDRNYDHYIDRLYAADTGGNIWRVDLEPHASNDGPAYWQVTKLASLGGTGATKRKLLFGPDIVFAKTFDAVLAGTGDREHPLLSQGANSIVNRFYMIKDKNIGMNGAAVDGSMNLIQSTVVDNSSSTVASAPTPSGVLFDATTTAYNDSGSGFYVTLNQNPNVAGGSNNVGEKVVNAPTSVGGYTYFATNQPTPPVANSCTANLGISRGYRVSFLSGASGFTTFEGGGLAPTAVYGLVTVKVDGKDKTLPFLLGGGAGGDQSCTGPDCTSSLGGQRIRVNPLPNPKRTYWYRDLDR